MYLRALADKDRLSKKSFVFVFLSYPSVKSCAILPRAMAFLIMITELKPLKVHFNNLVSLYCHTSCLNPSCSSIYITRVMTAYMSSDPSRLDFIQTSKIPLELIYCWGTSGYAHCLSTCRHISESIPPGRQDMEEKRKREHTVAGCFIRRVKRETGVRWEAWKRGEGMSRVIMGECRHSFPLVGEQRFCERGGERWCHSGGNWLDGLFGAEDREIVSSASMFVHRCMECVHRMCMCSTLSTVQLCTAHRPQTRQEKQNKKQYRHSSTGLL